MTAVVEPVVRLKIWNAVSWSTKRTRSPSAFQLGAARPQPCVGRDGASIGLPARSSVIPAPP
jgi:hypothetical protein